MTTHLLPRTASFGHRPWARWLGRLSAPFLDGQLAGGYPEGTSRVLAFRAQQISSPAGRRELAQSWAHLLDEARRPPVPRSPRAPLCRDRIAAAEHDVRAMIGVLTGALPVTARGAAMASYLLSDGTGPLYDRHSPVALGVAVREATRQMTDPAASTPADLADREKCYR
ncbi:MAG: hypothetical protein ACR2MP_24070 [Streptosporangiaceae bacterium]